jgi:hypothetical protein
LVVTSFLHDHIAVIRNKIANTVESLVGCICAFLKKIINNFLP